MGSSHEMKGKGEARTGEGVMGKMGMGSEGSGMTMKL
jgi:hypothetical protein